MYPGSNKRTFVLCCAISLGLCTEARLANGFGPAQADQSTAAPDKKKGDAAAKSKDDEPVYSPGADVKPPKLVHYVEPSFSPSSKEAFVEGVVKISTVVATNGEPTDLHVTGSLNSEEDRNAVEAVTQWRFEPGTKSGRPVKVRVTVEVDFHLL